MKMDIDSSQQGSITVIAINGSMDALTAPTLSEALRQQIEAGHAQLVIDLTALEYSSSAGLRALLGGVKDARQHAGDLRLAGLRPNVRKVLELSGFTTIMKIFPSVPEAVQSYS
jgi:anti-sigma B factor antagonist